MFLEFWINHGELLLVGVHQQIGQHLWLVGGVVREKLRSQSSLRRAIGTPIHHRQRRQQIDTDRAKWVLPCSQVGSRHREQIVDNCLCIRPSLASRVVLRQRRRRPQSLRFLAVFRLLRHHPQFVQQPILVRGQGVANYRQLLSVGFEQANIEVIDLAGVHRQQRQTRMELLRGLYRRLFEFLPEQRIGPLTMPGHFADDFGHFRRRHIHNALHQPQSLGLFLLFLCKLALLIGGGLLLFRLLRLQVRLLPQHERPDRQGHGEAQAHRQSADEALEQAGHPGLRLRELPGTLELALPGGLAFRLCTLGGHAARIQERHRLVEAAAILVRPGGIRPADFSPGAGDL